MTTLAREGFYSPKPADDRLFRFVMRAPLVLWRMGFHRPLSRWFVILTTLGRKSQQPRRVVVDYHDVDGKLYAYSGFGPMSDWYQNLLANPRVTLQRDEAVIPARARRVTDPDELLAVLQVMRTKQPEGRFVEAWFGPEGPTPEAIRENADKFYVIAFDPTEEPTPPPLAADLRWTRPVLGSILLSLVATGLANIGARLLRRRRAA